MAGEGVVAVGGEVAVAPTPTAAPQWAQNRLLGAKDSPQDRQAGMEGGYYAPGWRVAIRVGRIASCLLLSSIGPNEAEIEDLPTTGHAAQSRLWATPAWTRGTSDRPCCYHQGFLSRSLTSTYFSAETATAVEEPLSSLAAPIRSKIVRYIKLGESGKWERECVERGIIRIGFGSGRSERFDLCRSNKWDALTDSFVAEGRAGATATRFRNELRAFFQDDGSVLWITFIGQRLCWGSVEGQIERHADGQGVWRLIRDGWRSRDVNGEELTKDVLSGTLTKLASYRGTSCSVDDPNYVVGRINGEKSPDVEAAIEASRKLKVATLKLIRKLGPRDFELLVDLMFASSGWRRVGVLGKTQKTLDLDLILPTTGERAFVQVKSNTTSAELADYVEKIEDGPYERMFFVFHSGKAETGDPRVVLLGPDELPDLVADAGLVSWLIRRVS